MSYKFKFEKLLSISENEKDKILGEYNQAVKVFEETAEKLYYFLKQKEDLEAIQLQKLSAGLSIQEIRHHQNFVANLEKTIAHYQNLVVKARLAMQKLQAVLLEKNMEVKKFEKLREKDYQFYFDTAKADENKLMDEISLQQYMHR